MYSELKNTVSQRLGIEHIWLVTRISYATLNKPFDTVT